ncbi:CHAT domain-containing protein, partial [candidate division KSB1 bacterium]|nr:CHAT domain-containing protein [candidate division KSB1 bacterium]
MIWKSIQLQLSKSQISSLKAHNAKIIEHLEERQPLSSKVLDALRAELTTIVNGNADFTEVLTKINSSGEHYVVRLVHEDNEILNLPWTLAEDAAFEQPLAALQQLSLCKCPPNYLKSDDQRMAATAPPLKILLMISSPEDSDWQHRLSYEYEEAQILRAFEPLLKTGQIEVDYTDDGSLEALERKLKTNRYHILHFSGHGGFQDGAGFLELENPLTLKMELVPAQTFAETLNCNPGHTLPLVVLSSCQT